MIKLCTFHLILSLSFKNVHAFSFCFIKYNDPSFLLFFSIVFSVTMNTLLVLVALCGLCRADYQCLCNYNVETPVMDSVRIASTT